MHPTWSLSSTGPQTNVHVFAILPPLTFVILRLGDVGSASTHSTEKCFLFLFTNSS